MLTRFAVVSCAAALVATPVLGQAAINAKALDAHFAALSTEASKTCMDLNGKSEQLRLAACEVSLKELAAARTAARRLSAGQKANYDYKQVVLQTALAAAYAQTDKALSARACAMLESNWVIRSRLRTIPPSALSPAAYDTYQSPPAQLTELLGYCRADFPPAPGALPLPAPPAATK